MDKLSVIIVTFNSEGQIRRCLDSIAKNIKLPHEIIVVDNNSSDRTVDIIRKVGPQVRLICSPENLGFAKANNLAVRKSSGSSLFFLNPDTEVLDSSVLKLVSYLEENKNAGLVSPQLIDESGDVQPSVSKLPTIRGALAHYLLGSKESYGHYFPDSESRVEVECVVGAAMVIKKDFYLKLGGFDEKYFMYFEDLDLCRKIKKEGLKVVYLPYVKLRHKIGASASTNSKVSRYIERSFTLYHGFFAASVLRAIHQAVRGKNFFARRLNAQKA